MLFTFLGYAAYWDIVDEPKLYSETAEGTQFLLPGWERDMPSNYIAVDNEHGSKIDLDVGFEINYMGKVYTSLTIHPNGAVALGDYSSDLSYLANPFVRPLNPLNTTGISLSVILVLSFNSDQIWT